MFYQGLHIAYAVLLCAALWCNRACWRTLSLTTVLGAELMLVLPWTTPIWVWYIEWFAVEMVVIAIALALQAPASRPVAFFAFLLGIGHLCGAYFGPSEGVGLYRIIQPMLEVSQLLTCIALSRNASDLFKRQAQRALDLRGKNV